MGTPRWSCCRHPFSHCLVCNPSEILCHSLAQKHKAEWQKTRKTAGQIGFASTNRELLQERASLSRLVLAYSLLARIWLQP
jgi:hypothetical protein